jgi:hypothetical protein
LRSSQVFAAVLLAREQESACDQERDREGSHCRPAKTIRVGYGVSQPQRESCAGQSSAFS